MVAGGYDRMAVQFRLVYPMGAGKVLDVCTAALSSLVAKSCIQKRLSSTLMGFYGPCPPLGGGGGVPCYLLNYCTDFRLEIGILIALGMNFPNTL